LGGLPAGDLIADDDEEQEYPVIISERYGLKGKPDALVRTPDGQIIPVERGQMPPYVRIQYADRWFDEPYTPERKRSALQITQRLREARRAGAIKRSHIIAGKCRDCIQRQNCGQPL